ncbi:MAG: hypothetical protein MI784_01295 [Cytophagales bacterium]|nr:hypothetical protein [Cytophagales bacterium]
MKTRKEGASKAPPEFSIADAKEEKVIIQPMWSWRKGRKEKEGEREESEQSVSQSDEPNWSMAVSRAFPPLGAKRLPAGNETFVESSGAGAFPLVSPLFCAMGETLPSFSVFNSIKEFRHQVDENPAFVYRFGSAQGSYDSCVLKLMSSRRNFVGFGSEVIGNHIVRKAGKHVTAPACRFLEEEEVRHLYRIGKNDSIIGRMRENRPPDEVAEECKLMDLEHREGKSLGVYLPEQWPEVKAAISRPEVLLGLGEAVLFNVLLGNVNGFSWERGRSITGDDVRKMRFNFKNLYSDRGSVRLSMENIGPSLAGMELINQYLKGETYEGIDYDEVVGRYYRAFDLGDEPERKDFLSRAISESEERQKDFYSSVLDAFLSNTRLKLFDDVPLETCDSRARSEYFNVRAVQLMQLSMVETMIRLSKYFAQAGRLKEDVKSRMHAEEECALLANWSALNRAVLITGRERLEHMVVLKARELGVEL